MRKRGKKKHAKKKNRNMMFNVWVITLNEENVLYRDPDYKNIISNDSWEAARTVASRLGGEYLSLIEGKRCNRVESVFAVMPSGIRSSRKIVYFR